MAQEEEVQQYNWPATIAFLGGLALLFLWRQRRKRKKLEKMVREAQRRSEARRKQARAKREERAKVKVKSSKSKACRRKRREKEKVSMARQLVRFAVFQFLKKLISEQINRIELDLQKSPLGAKLVAPSKPQEATP